MENSCSSSVIIPTTARIVQAKPTHMTRMEPGVIKSQLVLPPNNSLYASSANKCTYQHSNSPSGQSKVTSIGVSWSLPSVYQNKPEKGIYSAKKPMWGWLVTPDTSPVKGKHKLKHRHSLQSDIYQSFPCKDSMHRVRNYHNTDLHPISTAMNQHGNSVSRTVWTVPVFSANLLATERSLLRRLDLARFGSNSVYLSKTMVTTR